MTAWLNGDFVDRPLIDGADRGFLLGDGAFETIYVDGGHAAFLSAHLSRLRFGLSELRIASPPALGDVAAIIAELAARDKVTGAAAARITITRGVGERGLRFSGGAPTMLVTLAPLPDAGREPLRAIISPRRRLGASATAGYKAIGGYIENMLAHNEAVDAGADQAILLNEQGRIAGAAAANIFVERDGIVATPPRSEGALPGIVREVLIGCAAACGIEVSERPIERAEIEGKTIFLTNSLIGVRRATLDGAPAVESDVFLALQSCYQKRLQEDLRGQD